MVDLLKQLQLQLFTIKTTVELAKDKLNIVVNMGASWSAHDFTWTIIQEPRMKEYISILRSASKSLVIDTYDCESKEHKSHKYINCTVYMEQLQRCQVSATPLPCYSVEDPLSVIRNWSVGSELLSYRGFNLLRSECDVRLPWQICTTLFTCLCSAFNSTFSYFFGLRGRII